MRKILSLLMIFSALTGIAQDKKAIDFFNEGVIAFKKRDFLLADSLFKHSAMLEPNIDTYFNIAVTRNELGDKCGFCIYLQKSISLGNNDVADLLTKHCFDVDTIFYKIQEDTASLYYCVYSRSTCFNIKRYYLCRDYLLKDIKKTDSFLVDTSEYKTSEITSPGFDSEKHFKNRFPYNVVGEMPSYPGGDYARIKFISENIIYPVSARAKNIQGTVYVTFVVEQDGALSDIKILKGIGGGCDEECVRIVKMMPKWIPGKHNGKIVRVQFNLPIKFTLQ